MFSNNILERIVFANWGIYTNLLILECQMLVPMNKETFAVFNFFASFVDIKFFVKFDDI